MEENAKKIISITIDPTVVEIIDRIIVLKNPPPSRSAYIEYVLKAYHGLDVLTQGDENKC